MKTISLFILSFMILFGCTKHEGVGSYLDDDARVKLIDWIDAHVEPQLATIIRFDNADSPVFQFRMPSGLIEKLGVPLGRHVRCGLMGRFSLSGEGKIQGFYPLGVGLKDEAGLFAVVLFSGITQGGLNSTKMRNRILSPSDYNVVYSASAFSASGPGLFSLDESLRFLPKGQAKDVMPQGIQDE